MSMPNFSAHKFPQIRVPETSGMRPYRYLPSVCPKPERLVEAEPLAAIVRHKYHNWTLVSHEHVIFLLILVCELE